ncbi:hypothetical protein Q1695_008748 [Nippostrongylus brasiliensis]|nr:hypothetical protein Q1695_008748 [Nippostrongylus brasiliensis]
MDHFAVDFKKRRIALGFTQREVAEAISSITTRYSQTVMSRFESRLLPLKNMYRMRQLLVEWLRAVDKSQTTSLNTGSVLPCVFSENPRRARTTIQEPMKCKLEQHFAVEHTPSPSTLTRLANEWGVTYQVVRVWFCNRRQKFRRETELLSAPLPEAVFVSTDPISDSQQMSPDDHYPLEQLDGNSELNPFQ